MSRVYENQCVGCPPNMGCSVSCPYKNVPVDYCDDCGDEAIYRIDERDLCASCARDRLREVFNELSPTEQGFLLNIDCSIIEG